MKRLSNTQYRVEDEMNVYRTANPHFAFFYWIVAVGVIISTGIAWAQGADCEGRTLMLWEATNKYSNFEEEEAYRLFEEVLTIEGCAVHETITAYQFLGDYFRVNDNPDKMKQYFLAALRLDPEVPLHPMIVPSEPFYEDVRISYFKIIRVETEPDSVRVTIDGQYLGESPLDPTYLEVGTHVVELLHASELYVTRTDTIEVTRDATVRFDLRKSEIKPQEGRLELEYDPADSRVYINGRLATEAMDGRLTRTLAIGMHRIEVEPTQLGYESETFDIEINEGDRVLKTINLRSGDQSVQQALTTNGSTGVLSMIYPYMYGRGFGFSIFSRLESIEPKLPDEGGSLTVDQFDKTFYTAGFAIVGSVVDRFTLGQAFTFMLSDQEVYDPANSPGFSNQVKWAGKSVTSLKMTIVETDKASWSVQARLDIPLFINGYFPGFSHPIFLSYEDSPELDYGGGTSFGVRGPYGEFLLNVEYTRYGERSEDLGYEDAVIGDQSLKYYGTAGIGHTKQFFVQFRGEIFDIKEESFMKSSELPTKITLGGRFLTSDLFITIGLSFSLAKDDAETSFNPTFVYPTYGAEISVGKTNILR